MTAFNPQPAADFIVRNRRAARAEMLPERDKPTNWDEAYAVQDAVFAQLGPIGGWKVGPGKDGAEPSFAPLLADTIHPSGATVAVPSTLPVKIEAEIAFRVPAFPDGVPDPKTLAGQIELVPLIEIMAVHLPKEQNPTPFEVMAAGANNHGVTIGAAFADWQGTDWSMLGITVRIDGEELYVTDVPDIDALVLLLHWTLDRLYRTGVAVPAGAIITTGALNGSTTIPGEAVVSVDFEKYGTIETRIVV